MPPSPAFDPGRDGGGSSDSFGAGEILSSAFKLSFPNIFSILVAIILWVLTIWIPYVNVGTTIALAAGLPRKLAEGGIISPFFIFESRWRKYLGDFFVLQGLMAPALLLAFSFLIVPFIVLSLSWCLALPLAMSEDTGATEAMSRSNELMAGHKWSAFFAFFGLSVIQSGLTIVAFMLVRHSDALWLPAIVYVLFAFPYVGVTAALYRKLVMRKPL